MASNIIRATVTSSGTFDDFFTNFTNELILNGFTVNETLSTTRDKYFYFPNNNNFGMHIWAQNLLDTGGCSYIWMQPFYGTTNITTMGAAAQNSFWGNYSAANTSTGQRNLKIQIVKNNGDVSIGLAAYNVSACTASTLHSINITKVDGTSGVVGLNGATAHDGTNALAPVLQSPATPASNDLSYVALIKPIFYKTADSTLYGKADNLIYSSMGALNTRYTIGGVDYLCYDTSSGTKLAPIEV